MINNLSQIFKVSENVELKNKIKKLEIENRSLILKRNQLEKDNNKYEFDIKELKNKIDEYEKEKKNLENENKKLIDENNIKNSQKDYDKNKITKIMEKINSNKPYEINGEKFMFIIFISDDLKMHYSCICKLTEKFHIIEDKLYDIYPEYRDNDNSFMVNGKIIDKLITLEENGIKSNDIIKIKINE